jgi:hypothetical protein
MQVPGPFDYLIDINDLHGELGHITIEPGQVRIGAMTRHRELLESDELATALPIFRDAEKVIADPVVRNRGTLGGSLCQADPSGLRGARPGRRAARGATHHLGRALLERPADAGAPAGGPRGLRRGAAAGLRRVVWLNPRAAAPGFEPRVASVAAALPHCDAMLPADSFRQLRDASTASTTSGTTGEPGKLSPWPPSP